MTTRKGKDDMATNPAGDNIDAVYYRDGVSNDTAMGALLRARMAMYRLFIDKMRPSPETTILDVGVSDDENDGANFLEKNYPWPGNITCAGLGEGAAVTARYPEVTFRQIEPGAPLPFADDSFDIVCSNAVLEHVGGAEGRRQFLLEQIRVARSVFLTVPHRWFPVEHHTGLPLLHYAPGLFRKLLRGTRYDHWTHVANVDFIDRDLLLREWPTADKPEVMLTGLPLGPFSSNIALVYRKPSA
jgi:SAM-dependent methyltransferase